MGVLLIVDVIKTACCGRVGDFKSGSTEYHEMTSVAPDPSSNFQKHKSMLSV